MKRKRRGRKAASSSVELFVRGFVVTALLSALQGRAVGSAPPPLSKVLRRAIQGGAALTAGTVAAEAFGQRDYGTGAAAILAGAAAIMAAETVLHPPLTQENSLGQEEA